MTPNRYRGISSMFFIILFILLLSINQTVEAESPPSIIINEVMYRPVESDHYNEWVELYNPTSSSIDVNGWTLYDGQQQDTLEGDSDHGNGTTIIPPGGYAIITDHGTEVYENFNVSENAIKLYVDDSAICGYGLNNEKEKLFLNDTSGTVIDAIEWGYDYLDVPGLPANNVNKGNSLARYHNTDTNNSIMDFYYGITPTPGRKNKVNFDIDLYSAYIPKIQHNEEYSVPFAIKANISNLTSNESYQLKSYIVGAPSGVYPATQTWNGTTWKWSYYYVFNITTDEHGNWTNWLYLRFKKDYQDYQKNIENNNTAYLHIKIKKDDISHEILKKVFLLDMDESTSNGTTGGCILGIAKENNTILQNKTIIVENNTGIVTGIYVTENNEIDDNFISTPGYYKISSPVGSGYTIKFCERNSSIIHVIQNVTIEQGEYGVDIHSPETRFLVRRNETLDILLTIKNTGDFHDVIAVTINHVTDGWQATLEQKNISLNVGETHDVNLHIIPCQQHDCRSASVTISVTSENDKGESDEITFQIDILAPDLTITKIKMYNEEDEEDNIFGEGESVRIKAFLKNLGNENATNVDVMFYYDSKDMEHFIGSKHYDVVSKYQKYPIVEWDTQDVTPGNHTVFVIADKDNQIDELDESNNELSFEIMILNTYPSMEGRNILITEVYYHAHSRINNEFIAIYNPSNCTVNVSDWYMTNQPLKSKEKQTKIIFPDNTTIPQRTCLYITQNASAYVWETGEKPDFEYNVDSDDNISQMFSPKKFTMSNKGGMVALKDVYNHTIDIVVYGESDYNVSGWKGPSIPDSGSGVILKRSFNQSNHPVDTNTSNDWVHPRRYGIGQSDFSYVDIPFHGEIKTFVSPDCSFQTIVDELRKANESIYFNIYEFTNPFLCDELVATLQRDVSVNIFVEGSPVGGIDDREKYILNKIASYGGNIRLMVNDEENNVHARYTFDHGKYLVIDNVTVIVESCNWAKTGIPIDPTYGNREWGIVVRSKDVAEYFLNVFLDDWNPRRCDSIGFDDMEFSVPSDFYMDESVISGSYIPEFEPETFVGDFSAIPVFSPDASYEATCNLIESARTSIYLEQLYIYKDWSDGISPFVEHLVNKSKQGVDIKVILNYNPYYRTTNEKCNLTKKYFEEHGIEVKFVYTNWSYFTNVHNKGMIVDNRSVLIASINWNENSVTRNREAGIIIENEEVSLYYASVFFYDWNLISPQPQKQEEEPLIEYKNTIYIAVIFTMTFALIARDWRKRQWVS